MLSLLSAGLTAIGPAAALARVTLTGPLRAAVTGLSGYFGTLALRTRLATAAAGTAPGVFARMGDAMLVAGRGVMGLLNPLKLVRGAAVLLRGALMFTGVGAVIATIAAAGTLIYNNWEGLVSFFQGVGGGFTAALGPVAPILQPIAGFAKDIFASISSLLGPLQSTNAEWKSWGETVGGTVGGAVRSIVEAIRSLIGVLSSAYEKAVAMGQAIKNAVTWGGSAGSAGGGASAPAGDGGGTPTYDAMGNVTGHRAKGGPVWPGGSFLVGENEPEIFTPKTGGTITPAGKAGGGSHGPISVTVNVQGASDPRETARIIERTIGDTLGDLLRGAHADMPAR